MLTYSGTARRRQLSVRLFPGPVTTAMEITGHKTRAMYDRCDAKNEPDKWEAIEKLAAHVGPQSSPQRLHVVS